jgi:hypothetical protein
MQVQYDVTYFRAKGNSSLVCAAVGSRSDGNHMLALFEFNAGNAAKIISPCQVGEDHDRTRP